MCGSGARCTPSRGWASPRSRAAGMDAEARARAIDRFKPTVIAGTPSYALYLGRTMERLGLDPRGSSVRTLFTGGEPAMGIDRTRERLEELWGCRTVEFYGLHRGIAPCRRLFLRSLGSPRRDDLHPSDGGRADLGAGRPGQSRARRGRRARAYRLHLAQLRELAAAPLPGGATTRSTTPALAPAGAPTSARWGSFTGRADDLINLRGVKFFPSQVEQAVRSVDGIGDEFEIVLRTKEDGLDVMDLRVEHASGGVADAVGAAVRSRCEIRVGVEVAAARHPAQDRVQGKNACATSADETGFGRTRGTGP